MKKIMILKYAEIGFKAMMKIRQQPMLRTVNLFISHSWAYGDAYDKLKQMLSDRTYFDFKDHSIPKDDPVHNAPTSTALYNAIKQKMSPCHVVLIMAGKYATYSEWINKEIMIAKKEFYNSKPIVAVTPWGAKQISTVVTENADRIAGWNRESVINCIRDLMG